MAIIGIDLGTTNSLACVYRDGKAELIPNELGEYKTSSAVSVLEDGTVLVGAAAKERLVSHPESTAASFKIWMGTDKTLTLGNKQFKPEELSALVLRQLLEDARRYLSEPVEEAVISVPAYFNDDQRCATKLAAQLAGLTVKRLINEPSAAALYHRHQSQSGDGQRMIVDFGGGTLDVSIVDCFENIIEITSIAGDNRLGGDDIDRAIVAHFCKENGLTEDRLTPSLRASLYRQAETAKIALSSAPAASIALQLEESQYSLVLTNDLLRTLCQPIFQKVRTVIGRAMKDRERSSRIRDVVLVGGSAQLSVFGDFLEELFGRRPHIAAGPDEIVALGVGLCAGIKERAEDLQDLVMTDVCPFSLGVATYNYAGDRTPHMAVLIPRSSMLPASHQERFYTLHDNQNGLRFEIYQGEGYFASENLKLGEVEVRVPPGPAGEQSALVTFTYDIDGILHVSAKSSGGDYRDRLILNPNLHLTEDGQAKAMERIQEIQLAAQGSQRDQLLLERGLRLYTQFLGSRRDMAGRLVGFWKSLMDAGDRIGREKHYQQISDQLDWLEAQAEADPLEGDFWFNEEEEFDDIVYVPFGMGKLPEYSLFDSAPELMEDIGEVLAQMGQRIEDRGGRMWGSNVNRHDSRQKLLMAQQKVGGVSPRRGRNHLLVKFIPSRYPIQLEYVDLQGERTVEALRGGTYGNAAAGLTRFMSEKLTRLRLTWAFQTPEGEAYHRHMVLLRDKDHFMLLWLQDDKQRADAYTADDPVRFLGHIVPASLVHQDLMRIRNCVDLLLDDIDNTEPVVDRPGEFVPLSLPYEEIRAALVKEE